MVITEVTRQVWMKKFECIRLQIRVFILSSLNFISCFIVNLKKDSSLIRCLAIFTQKQLQIEWEVYQKLYYAGFDFLSFTKNVRVLIRFFFLIFIIKWMNGFDLDHDHTRLHETIKISTIIVFVLRFHPWFNDSQPRLSQQVFWFSFSFCRRRSVLTT